MIKVLSIFLAFQVLLSSMSFNVGMHFCGDSLKSLALFGEATPCEHSSMAQEYQGMKDCPFHSSKQNSEDDDCCNDRELKVEGQQIDTTLNHFSFDCSPQFKFIASYVLSFFPLFQAEEAQSKFLSYKPPQLLVDIPVLIQVFRI